MKLFLFAISLCCVGCMDYENELKKVYEARQEMIAIFKDVSVFRGERMAYTFLYTYDSGKQNSYIFSIKKNEYVFHRDNILFKPDRVLNITAPAGTAGYRKELDKKLNSYLRIMDSLHITDVSNEFISEGLTLKLYMESNAILVYVSHPNNVTNPEWINYLKSMSKFDDNWYYAKEDR